MRSLFMCFIVTALLAGCASTPEPTPDVDSTISGPATPPPSDYQPVERGEPVTTQPLTARDMLSDPSNPLSVRSVYFDFDSYTILEEYKPALVAHARFLVENPTANMLIQGNTDERGTREYNLVLGQKRADAVKKMLVLLGAREDQIESVSLGEENPVATGQNEAAYTKNRRSDMLYRFQDIREF